MMTRLTFAVTTCFAPEILLMDEWIIAGDAGFLKSPTPHLGVSQKKSIVVFD
jgi:ABC-type polysaccharide/polyol phosphate transport system ATPase subunit